MEMTSEKLLCGYEIVSEGTRAEIRSQSLPLRVLFRGSYRQVKAEARRRGVLMSQAPFRGSARE